ncbi:hypothetical protein ALT_2645 [Aspergillus lentulus]|uniref:AB hydrolase-1 domain-containing protein n=1 Tax=Aspergillus lentulus TaxID=293939 RepID=A0AAN4PER3_ASPLE|nr:hypothetical protein ALT_2645 [Aspergillus lentulus]
MTSQRDIAIQTFDGLTLRGWFYSAGERRPCVILTHGTGALKEQYLPDFAECFQASGYGALVYNNRHFGASDGEPRSHADPLLQSQDYSAAFNYAASLAEVNPSEIILWGSSLSGGTALYAAAIDVRARGVIIQCPFVSSDRLREGFKDAILNTFADDPEPMDSGKEGSSGVMSDPVVIPYHAEMGRRGIPRGQYITLQSQVHIAGFEPKAFIHRISPRPLLMVVAEKEHTIPVDQQLDAFEQATEPKQIHIVKGQSHFRIYYWDGSKQNIPTKREEPGPKSRPKIHQLAAHIIFHAREIMVKCPNAVLEVTKRTYAETAQPMQQTTRRTDALQCGDYAINFTESADWWRINDRCVVDSFGPEAGINSRSYSMLAKFQGRSLSDRSVDEVRLE